MRAKTTANLTAESICVDGRAIAYCESGRHLRSKAMLLDGRVATTHRRHDLVESLGYRFHVIAPDCFRTDRDTVRDAKVLIEAIVRLSQVRGMSRFGLYMQDFPAAIGNAIGAGLAVMVDWLVIQNSPAATHRLAANDIDGIELSQEKFESAIDVPIRAFLAPEALRDRSAIRASSDLRSDDSVRGWLPVITRTRTF